MQTSEEERKKLEEKISHHAKLLGLCRLQSSPVVRATLNAFDSGSTSSEAYNIGIETAQIIPSKLHAIYPNQLGEKQCQ